ncbi:hypothetical protein AB0E83_06525 [Streptomyces sp. NPDC035033]|uniref:hypothetical protein n=1 Tax=Streptomyces sp. NPDC035033 TaxID=3155368 RepID=UPI0033F1D49D
MTSARLGPTHRLGRGERLLRGRSPASAAGAGTAEDWVRLDRDVRLGTEPRTAGRKHVLRVRVGAHWFDQREYADWDTAPYWREAGAEADGEAGPSWGRPPTPAELALGLCHADERVRAAALDAAGPRAPLPLLLLRCADPDEAVRRRARASFAPALDAADDGTARSLAALALLTETWPHGRWARDAVLARTGGAPERAVAELLAGEREETRSAGSRAGAEAGLLDADALYGSALTARPGRYDAERLAAVRAALGLGRGPAARRAFLGFLDGCEVSEVRVASLRYALAAGLLSPEDLAGVAVRHHDRRVRRLAARVLPDLPGADAALAPLLSASDGVVRGTAVARLRAAGRADGLVPHLTDPSPWVRGLARRALRAAGGDPRARLRAVCADPAAVTPPAVSALAEERAPGDAPLLRTLTRHADGAVRARALAGLRLLGALPDAGLPPYADDPDPRVGAVVLRALRDDPEALRGLLGHRHARVRARALVLLSHRHGLGWDEALPHLADPAPEVVRAARHALRYAAGEAPTERLLAFTAPGEPPARRALAMELLLRRATPETLLNALRLLDDPQPEVRASARREAQRLLWDRTAARGPHAAAIRALAARDEERIAAWRAETRRRNRAARGA